MQTSAANSDLLEFFYKHVVEPDWLEGIDLYQAGKVEGLEQVHGLITGRISDSISRPAEVRLKLHPSGKCIQWIECTCKKNRVQGYFCEHIAALMIHIDREMPKLLSSLDAKMPIKPPSVSKVIGKKIKDEQPERSTKNAAGTILDHLKGAIGNVTLVTHGPVIRVKLEIKEGHSTFYDLDLDSAARFLLSKGTLVNASKELSTLRVFSRRVELATRVYEASEEEIVAERVVAIRHTPKEFALLDAGLVRSHNIESCIRMDRSDPAGSAGIYEFISIKSCQKYCGSDYFFQPARGYWPLDKAVSNEWSDHPIKRSFKNDKAAKFLQTELKDYLQNGPVFIQEDLQQPTLNEHARLMEIKLHSEENGWFTLDPRYCVSDQESVSMAELMKHFSRKKRNYLKSGKSWIKIPDLITQHDWQLDETGQYIKVDAIGLMRLKAAIGDYDQFVGSKQLLNTMRNRLEFRDETEPPNLDHTKLNLRPYQKTGLRWLWWLYENHLHGLMADEMGLGKTHQAMGLLSAIQKNSPTSCFLVIAPTTVLDHWNDKVLQFCPNLKPFIHHGSKRDQKLSNLGRNGLHTVITSYGVLLRDIAHISKLNWQAIILDEAHFVKNHETATYRAACRLRGDIRICLTGTPMENHLGELKNIFDFLVPGYLGSNDYFRKNFVLASANNADPENELVLQKLIHPFKMRRTKSQVLTDLPAKVEDLRHCSLSAEQARLYRSIVDMKSRPLIEKIQDDNNPIPFLHVFSILTMLKQLCNHPCLLEENSNWRKHESGKFEAMKELIEEALGSGHKIVIYSQYVRMIRFIEEYLNDKKIGNVVLTGQTRARGKVIANFQEDPDCKVFIGSLLAGGIGIDLTAASVVIHYDRWWNATKENQATDRVHRIGQQRNVQVFKMICRGTLEEKIHLMIESKRSVFERFLDRDEEVFKSLSRKDLIELLT